MSFLSSPSYSPNAKAASYPARPRRQSRHKPSLSSGARFRNGVRQPLQKNSAIKGTGAFRQRSQTGIRDAVRSGTPHTRQSSGKTRENAAAERVRNGEASTIGLVNQGHRPGKTHLRPLKNQ